MSRLIFTKFIQNFYKVFVQCFGTIKPIFVIILIHKVSFEILDSEKWSYFRYLEGVCSGLCGVLNLFLTNIQFGVGCNSSILPPFRTHQRLNSTITYWDFNYRQSFQRLQVRGSLWRFEFAERSGNSVQRQFQSQRHSPLTISLPNFQISCRKAA